jgi:hypothetical protein
VRHQLWGEWSLIQSVLLVAQRVSGPLAPTQTMVWVEISWTPRREAHGAIRRRRLHPGDVHASFSNSYVVIINYNRMALYILRDPNYYI